MTAVIGGISVFIEDDSARFTSSMQRNAAVVEQQSQRMSRGLGGVAKSVDDLNRKANSFQPDAFRYLSASALNAQNSVDRLQKSMLALTALAGGGFAGAFAVKSLTEAADRYTAIQNRIASIIPLTKDRISAEQQIFDISQATRTSFESTAQLYQRLNLGAQALGATQGQILEVVKTLQQTFLVGGSTMAEAASAATQVSQALASGTLNGDELRSVLENNAVLSKAIADEFGVTSDKLKQMGKEGELASDRVFKAILKAGPDINEAFERSTPTFGQAVQVLDNALTRYVGQADKSLGVTNAMAQGVIALANNLQTLGQVAATVAPVLAAIAANRLGQAIGGRVGAGFRAERATRQEALKEATEARAAAAGTFATVGARSFEVETQARVNPESFVESQILKTREALRKQLAAEDAAVLAEEAKFQTAMKAAAQSGAIPTNAAVLRPERDALSQANRGLREAQREQISAISDDAPTRIQERLNGSLQKEEVLRRRINTLAYEARRNLPETIGDPDEARVKGTAKLLAAREQLQRQQTRSAQLAAEFAAAEESASGRIIAANERIVASQAAVVAAEQNLARSALARGNTAAGGQILAAQAGVEAAQQRRQGTAEALGTAEAAARYAGIANGTKAVDEARKAAVSSARALGDAEQVLAQRSAAASMASVALATATNALKAGFGSVVAFLGGPIGAALTAAAVGWSLYEISAARATAKNEEFKDAGDRVVNVLDRIREALAKQAGIAPAITEANKTVDELEAGISRAVQSAMEGLPRLANQFRGLIPSEAQQRLLDLQAKLFDVQRKGGDVTPVLKDIADELNSLGNMNPKFAGIISGLGDVVTKAVEGAEKVVALKAAVEAAKFIGPPIPEVASELGNDPRKIDEMNKKAQENRINQAFEAEKERKRLVGKLTQADINEAVADKDREREAILRRAQINEENPTATPAQREKLLKDAMSKLPKPTKAKETPEERLSERIGRIREESEAALLTEIDKDVISEITKTKGTKEIAAKINAELKAGRPLTGEFADLRSAIVAREAAKEYKNIVQEYGNLAQVTPMVVAEQEKLNFLMQNAGLTSMQASSALADYISKFKEFKWIDSLTDSFKAFGETLADTLYDGKLNAESFAQAIDNLGKAIFKLALNEVALEPLRQMMRGGLANFFAGGLGGRGGGGGDPDFANVTASEIMHTGGIVGLGRQRRLVPSSLFQDAPHYAGGLRPGEFASILHQGEAVLTRRDQMGVAAMAGGLSGMQGGLNVTINEAPGTQAQVSQGAGGGLQVDIFQIAESGLADRVGRGHGPLGKAVRAGGRSNLRG